VPAQNQHYSEDERADCALFGASPHAGGVRPTRGGKRLLGLPRPGVRAREVREHERSLRGLRLLDSHSEAL
jgi:hypothetical protein